jgi:hypothetical protein
MQSRVPGAPVGGGAAVKYKTLTGTGAMLLTEGPITERMAKEESSVRQWMTRDYAEKIMQKSPDTRQKGIWIVTKTYTATRRAFAVLQSKETEVSFEMDLKIFDVGDVDATASWWKGHKDSAWTVHDDVSYYLIYSDIVLNREMHRMTV